MVCSSFLLLYDSSLIDCMFIRIHPFLLGCVIFWHIIAQNNLLMMQEDHWRLIKCNERAWFDWRCHCFSLWPLSLYTSVKKSLEEGNNFFKKIEASLPCFLARSHAKNEKDKQEKKMWRIVASPLLLFSAHMPPNGSTFFFTHDGREGGGMTRWWTGLHWPPLDPWIPKERKVS